TSKSAPPRGAPFARSDARSSATSPARSTAISTLLPQRHPRLDIHRRFNDGGPTWKNHAYVEWQVARWVHWYNRDRLHSSIGQLPPIEFEHAHRQATTVTPKPEVA